jgi:Family of unknown function (DUF5985)
MKPFFLGLLAMASAIAALFFLRFWRLTGDRLFIFFALAFAALMINWVGLTMLDPALEARHGVYLVRLLAFALILLGIVDKNRRDKHS